MKCPHCNVSLIISDRLGIEIDYCPECRGVWLDRGELDKIIERSLSFLDDPSQVADKDGHSKYKPASYEEDYRKSRTKHNKKQNMMSFLEDIFDLG